MAGWDTRRMACNSPAPELLALAAGLEPLTHALALPQEALLSNKHLPRPCPQLPPTYPTPTCRERQIDFFLGPEHSCSFSVRPAFILHWPKPSGPHEWGSVSTHSGFVRPTTEQAAHLRLPGPTSMAGKGQGMGFASSRPKGLMGPQERGRVPRPLGAMAALAPLETCGILQ